MVVMLGIAMVGPGGGPKTTSPVLCFFAAGAVLLRREAGDTGAAMDVIVVNDASVMVNDGLIAVNQCDDLM